jgi:hypothetical protein
MRRSLAKRSRFYAIRQSLAKRCWFYAIRQSLALTRYGHG